MQDDAGDQLPSCALGCCLKSGIAQSLSASDAFTMQKEVYIQTQNWARHNETLIIATNTIILGASAAIATVFFRDPESYSEMLFVIPALGSCVGLIFTFLLTSQYRHSISRLVRYEKFFGLHSDCPGISDIAIKGEFLNSKWGSTFVPQYLSNPPRFGPTSSLFFIILHIVVIGLVVLNFWR